MIRHGVCSTRASTPGTPVPGLDRCQSVIIGDKMRTLLLVVAVLCGPLLIFGGCSNYAGSPVTAHNPNDSGGSGGGSGGGGMGY
jgi:hypothetical protein